MTSRRGHAARRGLLHIVVLVAVLLGPALAWAAPYAAFVMDARTGEVIHARNADTPLHPASLTKMMTLFIAFQAIERGEISLDTEVRISANAAGEEPMRLGLREGQTLRLRYLLRAAAIMSANDAATAIGEALAGSESAFAARMNATAAAMGMTNTHFVNMNGLTAEGHYSTARDMSVLGRHVIYDFPQYYNLFSRRTADAGVAEVSHTNRRFLDSYEGADGIKTGFTNAAGYNLVASAERNGVRIIATVFGATSGATRNARVAELLDMGFDAARPNARLIPPEAPGYATTAPAADAAAAPEVIAGTGGEAPAGAGHTIRVTGALTSAPRPGLRPSAPAGDDLLADAVADAVGRALDEDVDAALAEALGLPPPDDSASLAPDASAPPLTGVTNIQDVAALTLPAPPPASAPSVADPSVTLASAPETVAPAPAAPEPTEIIMTAEAIMPETTPDEATEVVTRLSTSGATTWGINVGRFNTRDLAERALLQVALVEASVLMGGVRSVQSGARGHDANVVGLTRDAADLACRRLQARNIPCFMLGG